MNGFIAIGSRRSTPTSPAFACVVSLAIVAPMKMPCSHDRASVTSGTRDGLRPPNSMALIGTPSGVLSYSAARLGALRVGVVNRLLGWATLTPYILVSPSSAYHSLVSAL